MGTPRRFVAASFALLLALTPLLPVAPAGSEEAALPPALTTWRTAADAGVPVPERAEACPADAPRRTFDVVAIRIPVSYNHWGDFDPEGRLFVLAEEEAAVREQVAAALARAGHATVARLVANPARAPAELGYTFPSSFGNAPNADPFDVSELVRPLVVRAHVGDCVTFTLVNRLPEPVGLHVHRAVTPAGQGGVTGREAPDVVAPGATGRVTAFIPDAPGMEGAHYLHSHADERYQTKHGLFGALVAESKGTAWLAPDGSYAPSGPEAMIVHPDRPDHREFVVFLHDEVELVDRSLTPLPMLGPYDEYGPGSKAMNLRAELFMNRFLLHDRLGPEGDGVLDRGHDKSQGYSSYTYGDPGLFVPTSYVGDPMKIRLVGAGPGQHHSFHLHGGGVRWRASPVAEDSQFAAGLVKDNPVPRAESERNDVQLVGPGESFNLEVEGGSGGVQQSVGDFLFHCHVVEHYVAGMWSYWRVVNTARDGLAELPDRAGRVQGAVPSTELIGRTMPDGTTITVDNVVEWAAAQLPTPGVPGKDDASVWDWAVADTPEGPLVLGEPETEIVWPNYESPSPGERPALGFDPVTGRLAYPFLSPHFGERPPFAGGHGPAPYLGPDASPTRPDGLCPPDARRIAYNVVALSTPVAYNDEIVDPDGQVFVLAEHKRAILAGEKEAGTLAIRANKGDCVDVLLTSQLDEREDGHSKVNMHIHLVQFDVQASDGVITGFNHEQSVRPAATTGTALAAPAAPGDVVVRVADAAGLHLGSDVGIGLTEAHVELRRVVAVDDANVTLDAPLAAAHAAGERVGHEFVRYRWFADVELGTVYWHDHVDGLNSWRHGLYGALIVEPEGSVWLHPETGEPVPEGTQAVIVTADAAFREQVVAFQDKSAVGSVQYECLTSFNLRSAPFDSRDPERPLATTDDVGDPATDVLRAYPGDPVVYRLLYSANANSRAVGTFGVTGHRFPAEAHLEGSRTVDTVSFGISQQLNLHLECGAGGCARLPGDYLYGMTQPEWLERGAWGLMRVHETRQPDLPLLPGRTNVTAGTLPDGPVRRYEVAAVEADVTINAREGLVQRLRAFVPVDDADAVRSGETRPTPLVMRASPGDVVEVVVHNRLPDAPVTLSASLVLADPRDGGLGIPVGENPDPRVMPGETRTFRWFADREVGAAHLASYADPARDTLDGLYGALVVEPAGATWDADTGPSATLTLANGDRAREHVLLYASDDPVFQGSIMPYTVDVAGTVTVNYRTEPVHEREGGRLPRLTSGGDPIGGPGVHACQVNTDSCTVGGAKETRPEARNPFNPFAYSALLGEPETPLVDAVAGEALVVRALGGAGDQLQVHHVAGHAWRQDPALGARSNVVDAVTLGPREVSNAWLTPTLPGDYWWGSERAAFAEAGAWGVLRVREADA